VAKPKKPWFARWWVWVLIVLVLLIILGSLGGGHNNSSAPTANGSVPAASNPAAPPASAPAAPPAVPGKPGVGTPVAAGDTTVTLKSFETTKKLSSVFGTKKGYWMSVKVTVANNGKDAITIDNSSFTLLEPDGTEYETDSDALMYIDSKESIFLEKINPKKSATGRLLFAIPESAKDLTLKFNSGLFGPTAEISLRK
jgi:hypothetical protein